MISRREFIRVGAVGVMGIALPVASGCTAQPQSGSADVETPSTHLDGGPEMSGRVLVGYATRTGSTVGVAEAIGRALSARGLEVDIKPLRERPSLSGYDAAILGSAVNGAAWLPEAISYVKSNADALAALPTAVFCVHSMNGGSDEKQTRKRLAYLDEVRAVVTPTDEGFFLGKGPDPDDTSFMARWAFRAFGGSGEGDMRDWSKIDGWAREIAMGGVSEGR